MKERGILFGAPTVRALLAGTKTQTRRLLKPFPTASLPTPAEGGPWDYLPTPGAKCAFLFKSFETEDEKGGVSIPIPRCPYGVPGDRLWVREDWKTTKKLDDKNATQTADMCLDAGWTKPWAPVEYSADGHQRDWDAAFDESGRQRRARFMPRYLSRITLEVTEVRVQRLQAISEEDARAEGVEVRHDVFHPSIQSSINNPARRAYAVLWDSINGAGSWDSSPWVWCVSFRRVEGATP